MAKETKKSWWEDPDLRVLAIVSGVFLLSLPFLFWAWRYYS
ncbi:MAG: hypothetical protein AAB353_13810 [Candidatus Hydrogenedentota bacterium]